MSLMRHLGLERMRAPLSHRNFRIYLSGNSISLVGTWMQRIAMAWLAWELTGSEFWLGVVAFVGLFPAVIFGPIGGIIADRYERRQVLILCSIASFIQSAVLCVLSVSGLMNIGVLVILALIAGVINGFYHPIRLSIMPNLLPREDLPNAIALNSVAFNTARFIGPMSAGMLIVSVGVSAAFAVNAFSYLAFIWAMLKLDDDVGRPKEGRAHAIPASMTSQLTAAARYILRHPLIFPMLCLMVFVSITQRPLMEMFPAFASEHLSGGARTLAMLTAANGVGAMIAGFVIAGRTSKNLVRTVLLSTITVAVVTILFVNAQTLLMSLVFAALSGASMSVSAISLQILVQLCVDDDIRGRVLSLYSLVFFGGPAFGALAMGLLSDQFGLIVPFVVGSVMTVAIVAALMALCPQIITKGRELAQS